MTAPGENLHILRAFRREPDGHWTCLERVEIATADGPVVVEPGRRFAFGERAGELDVAEYLEQLGAQYGS